MKVLNKTRNFDKFSKKINKKELPAAGCCCCCCCSKVNISRG